MYRILKGLTQADLAARVGMSVIAISNIETGKCKPSIRHWLRICKVLEIPYDLILDEEDAAHPAKQGRFELDYLRRARLCPACQQKLEEAIHRWYEPDLVEGLT